MQTTKFLDQNQSELSFFQKNKKNFKKKLPYLLHLWADLT